MKISTPYRALFALFMVHFSGDFYQSFFRPLFPLFRDDLNISLSQIGYISLVITVSSFIIQPVMGFWADHSHPRKIMSYGLALSAVFIPLIASMPFYGALLICCAFGAMGSSMYHPSASAFVIQHMGRRAGLGMSIFGLAGTLAFSVGPIAVTTFVTVFEKTYLPVFSLLGIFTLVLIHVTLTDDHPAKALVPGRFSAIKELGAYWKPIFIIWLVASLRSFTDASLQTYFPILFRDAGNGLVSIGGLLSLYTLGSATAAIICGQLVDQYGYKTLFYLSFTLSAPAIWGLLHATGIWTYIMSFCTGFILLATMFPSVSLAAQLVPGHQSLVASLTLGFAVGCGGTAVPVFGVLAESHGLDSTLHLLVFLPLICLVLAYFIPDYRMKN